MTDYLLLDGIINMVIYKLRNHEESTPGWYVCALICQNILIYQGFIFNISKGGSKNEKGNYTGIGFRDCSIF